ncbi:hypothetical protein [Mariniflexile maritimum]|uniref:hypothetical protein n=1 Tax=Mariniflexile maritimum TaxID=2682493 RepID=UPI0012F68802|nr:hypothetical protein [Mariniflexile maritimum]MCB0449610.1 hypothetical protein [Confluentibacter sp.]
MALLLATTVLSCSKNDDSNNNSDRVGSPEVSMNLSNGSFKNMLVKYTTCAH